jgi:hypothetical protein
VFPRSHGNPVAVAAGGPGRPGRPRAPSAWWLAGRRRSVGPNHRLTRFSSDRAFFADLELRTLAVSRSCNDLLPAPLPAPYPPTSAARPHAPRNRDVGCGAHASCTAAPGRALPTGHWIGHSLASSAPCSDRGGPGSRARLSLGVWAPSACPRRRPPPTDSSCVQMPSPRGYYCRAAAVAWRGDKHLTAAALR